MTAKLQITFDAADPHALVRFWAQALHYDVEDHSGFIATLLEAGRIGPDDVIQVEGRAAFRDAAAARDPEGRRPRVYVQLVQEPKTAKNRMHLDMQVGAEEAPAEIQRLIGLGATVAWTSSDRGPFATTMRDPEGNEFCVS